MRKYTLYAIGEIALVVIGILIALQVNNWNEARKIKSMEIKLLKGFVKEMVENQRILDEAIEIHSYNLANILDITDNWNELNNEEKVNSINSLRAFFTMDLLSGVIKSLLTGNTLNIISSDSLKSFITSWEDKVVDISENEVLDAHYTNNVITPYLYRNFSIKALTQYPQTKTSSVLIQINKMVQESEFEGILIQRHSNLNWGINEMKSLSEELEDIINLASK
jgi:hypothetical protein